MYAKLNDLISHLNNKHKAHKFYFLHLHRRVPVKNSAVAHENVRLTIGMYGILSELWCLIWFQAVVFGPYHEAA